MRAMISSSAIVRRVDPAPRGGFGRELLDDRIRNARAAAGFVLVPPGPGLLPVAAHLVQAIRHLRLRSLGARLANRLEVLANPRAHVDAGDVLHAERTHRHPEVSQRLVDLRHARALLEQQIRLAHVIGEHAIGHEAETIADDDADLVQLACASFSDVAMTSWLVSRPRTISSSFITLAGLKK